MRASHAPNLHTSLKIDLTMYKMSSGLYICILKSPLFYTAFKISFEKNFEKHDYML